MSAAATMTARPRLPGDTATPVANRAALDAYLGRVVLGAGVLGLDGCARAQRGQGRAAVEPYGEIHGPRRVGRQQSDAPAGPAGLVVRSGGANVGGGGAGVVARDDGGGGVVTGVGHADAHADLVAGRHCALDERALD